ncbi:MAG: hypothetical protein ACOVQE_10170 [Chitinophagaceae bacterium]
MKKILFLFILILLSSLTVKAQIKDTDIVIQGNMNGLMQKKQGEVITQTIFVQILAMRQ